MDEFKPIKEPCPACLGTGDKPTFERTYKVKDMGANQLRREIADKYGNNCELLNEVLHRWKSLADYICEME